MESLDSLYDESFTIEIDTRVKPQEAAEVTDAYLNVQEVLIVMCHKYDIARDDQLALYRAVFNLQKEK